MPLDASSFWNFSLQIYSLPDVAPACLSCQDDFDADVNILLFALWCAKHGLALPCRAFTQAEADVYALRRNVTQPLRTIRRFVRHYGYDSLYNHIKEAELAAERIEQEMLVPYISLSYRPSEDYTPFEIAGGNLSEYSKILARSLPISATSTLLSAFTKVSIKD